MDLSHWTQERGDLFARGTRADAEAAAQATLAAGGEIDPRFRAAAWALLLGQAPANVIAADASALPSVALSLSNQRTVHVDAERTRQDLPAFRGEAAVHRVELILTHYCHCAGVRYRQGLNELLAPIMLLEDGAGRPIGDGASYNLLVRVVRFFAPRFFASDDADFISLQCSFRLFRLLALYHDPVLAAVLDQYELPPELFASPWFLTLFARNHNDLAIVYYLWDFLFGCAHTPGPAALHFVALAFLRAHRSIVVDTARDNAEVAELPMKLARLTFASVDEVRAVCAAALDLFSDTPRSLRVLLHNVCYSAGGTGTVHAAPVSISPSLLVRLERRICCKISVDEAVTGAGSRFSNTGSAGSRASAAAQRGASGLGRLLTAQALQAESPRYFLIDCRTKDEFDFGGRLPTAFHFDPILFDDPELLDERMAVFKDLHGVHFAIMGPGSIDVWYHAPVAPESNLSLPSPTKASGDESEIAPAAQSRGDPGQLYNYGVSAVDGDELSAVASSTADEDALAMQSGLLPLNANEEDDYGGASDVTRKVALCFLQRGFLHVSEVEGGFTAMHQRRAHFLSAELVNHVPEHCMVCSGGRALATYPGLRESEARGDSLTRPSSAGRRPAGSARRTAPSRLATPGPFPPPRGRLVEQPLKHTEGVSATSGALAAADVARQWLVSAVSVPESSQSQPRPAASTLAAPSGSSVDAQSAALNLAPRTAAPPASARATPPPIPQSSVLVTARTKAAKVSSELLFDGVDGHGLPLLSELALLDIQCDALERECEEATGRRVIPASMAQIRKKAAARRRQRPRQASSGPVEAEVVYVEDVLYSAASATASALQRMVSPPAASGLRLGASSARAAAPSGSAKNSQLDDVPIVSLADFMAGGEASTDSAAIVATVAALPPATPGGAVVLTAVPPAPSPARQRSTSTSFTSLLRSALSAPPPSVPPLVSGGRGAAASSDGPSLPAADSPASSAAAPRPLAQSAAGGITKPLASAVASSGADVTVDVVAANGGLPAASVRRQPSLAASTTGISISVANSRYLDTIRRAALAGLESIQPPRK